MNKKDCLNLPPIAAIPKSGNEALTYNGQDTGYGLIHFWQWSVSDILSNATRGRFAEFIVGTAIGLECNSIRDEWGAYDLENRDGIKIEVKSASYIQCWNQKDYSAISFSIKPAKHWDAENGMSKGAAKRHADIYVFCLLKNKNQQSIDPMKLEQWSFFVLPTFEIDNYKRSQSSITLQSLSKLADEIMYSELGEEVIKAYSRQIRNNQG